MTTPVTAEWFTQHGVPAEQAATFAEEHNRLAGMRPEAVGEAVEQTFQRLPKPVPQPSTDSALTDAQRARAEMSDIQARRARGDISDYQWNQVYERKFFELAGVASAISAYESALPGDQNAARVAWDADATLEAFERSIDMERPARSPADYQLPRSEEMTDKEVTFDKMFRQALYAAGAPRELGNNIGHSVNQTAKALTEAQGNLEAEVAIVEGNERRLRQRWGAAYEQNLKTVKGFLRDAGARSSELRSLVNDYPWMFSSPDTMNYMLNLAQSRSRMRGESGEPSTQEPISRVRRRR